MFTYNIIIQRIVFIYYSLVLFWYKIDFRFMQKVFFYYYYVALYRFQPYISTRRILLI